MRNVYTKSLCLCWIFTIGFALTSCAHSVKVKSISNYQPLSYDEKFYVYELKDLVPGTFEILGEIRIGDTGFSTDCGYEKALNLAETEARKLGGNAIKITQHYTPNVWTSTCHRIVANVLRVNPPNKSDSSTEEAHDLIVLESGTELECTITGSDDQFIYFTVFDNGTKATRRAERESIRSIERNINK